MQATVGDLRAEKGLLRKENEWLGKEGVRMQERERGLEAKVKEMEERVDELTAVNARYLKELLEYRDRCQVEVYSEGEEKSVKLRLAHERDLALVRRNIVSEYEARESLFKDQRDEAEIRARRLEKENSVLKVGGV